MKTTKKLCVCFLALLMLFSIAAPAFAENDTPSEKEEVIYLMTDASGAVKNVYAVNIFEVHDVVDYGNYATVRMLTTNDTITQDWDKITYSTEADKSYYQGTLLDVEIPWDISIRYFMDGEEYTPEEIAGRSGELEIQFSVKQNENCNEVFFKSIALQASFTLSTNVCRNITSRDATVANVGADKQLTYTILPGRELTTSIKADATDFRMDPVSINGIKLSLNIELDDAELTDKVNELILATKRLNEGSREFHVGASNLREGAGDLNEGMDTLNSSVEELDNGIAALQRGLSAMQSGLNTLNGESSRLKNGSAEFKDALIYLRSQVKQFSMNVDDVNKLTSASGEVKSGINKILDGVNQFSNAVSYAQFKSTLASHGADIDLARSYNSQAASQISEIATLLKNLGLGEYAGDINDLIDLFRLNTGIIDGTREYFDALSSNASTLKSGISELSSSYATFDAAIRDLTSRLSKMADGITELTDGINELVDAYTEIDDGIGAYVDGVAQVIAGYHELTSGVSEMAAGSKELIRGTGRLSRGATDLYNGVIELCDGADEISSGTSELYENTEHMDTEIREQIDDILAELGGSAETISFVSEKNTNIKSLQFVIKTDGIETAPDVVDDEDAVEQLTFWQKLLRLFKLY